MAKRSHSGELISETETKSSNENMALKLTVDEVLLNYWKSEPDLIFNNQSIFNYFEEGVDQEDLRLLRTDQVVVTELGSELWERGFKTAFADITIQTIPHYRTIEAFINYTLNVENIDLGLTKTFFSGSLFFHPPDSFPLEVYYWHILHDKFVRLRGIEVKDTIFSFSLDSAIACLQNPEFILGSKNYLFGLANILKKRTTIDISEMRRGTRIGFRGLSECDKFQRVVIILEYLYEIFEADYLYRTEANRFITTQNRTLFSQLIWHYAPDIGTVNDMVRKVTQFFVLMETLTARHLFSVHKKLITMMGEIIRFNGYKNDLYPFFGTDSEKLAGEIAIQLYNEFWKKKNEKIVYAVCGIRPHWLRLLVCCKFLTYVSCKKYFPELPSVHDVLGQLVFLNAETRDRRTSNAIGVPLTKKRHMSEESRLNLESECCYEGCVLEECLSLQKREILSRMKVNKFDDNGWAPLHRAVLMGHDRCVDELLKYEASRLPDENSRANTRLKGFKDYTPIMCALIKEDGNICRLLLQHSGPQILEDVNSHGETAYDLCNEFDVGRIIRVTESGQYSKTNRRWYITKADVPAVVELCVQFVESYLVTHRTRDVIERLKTSPPNPEDLESQNCWNPIKWNYNRYEKDINENIKKIVELVNMFRGDEKSKNRLQSINLLLNYTPSF